MKTTHDFIKEIVRKNSQIHGLYFREYIFPATPVGTEPAYKDKIYPVQREEFLDDKKFELLKKRLDENHNLGIESKVNTPQGDLHIPMMDFSLSKSPKSRNLIKKLWKKSMIKRNGKGAIFETDNSYHFIGNKKLLTENEYLDFLSWCLLLINKGNKEIMETVVDVQYVAYCLLKRSGCLRITKYPYSKITPHLIFQI